MTFPAAATEEQFEALDDQALRPGVDALRHHLNLTREAIRFDEGSLPVYAIGEDLVLKLFPPVYADETEIEAAALQAVHGKLAVPTPKLHETGEFDGWGYVLMERMKGTPVTNPTASQCAQLGEALRALHEIEPPQQLPAPNWPEFVATRTAHCQQRQRDRGLEADLLDQIPDFLERTDLGTPKMAMLHTEVMNAHLVEQDGVLTGLFDFEPSMRGATEYEFVATGIFVVQGDPEKQRAIHDGYGSRPDPDAVLAYTLLHVYSNLPWYLTVMPREATLEELAQRWFAG